jgi:HEAT repeat protein
MRRELIFIVLASCLLVGAAALLYPTKNTPSSGGINLATDQEQTHFGMEPPDNDLSQPDRETMQREIQRLRDQVSVLQRRLQSEEVASWTNQSKAGEESLPFHDDRLLSIYQEVRNSTSKARTLQLLRSLSEYVEKQDLALVPIVRQALTGEDPETCRLAILLLEQYESPAILPAVRDAFALHDEETRLAALTPLARIHDPQVPDLLKIAFNDVSEAVRSRALEVAIEQPADIQLKSLEQGLLSMYEDTQSQTLTQLELQGDKSVVEPVIRGFQSPRPEFREEVRSVLQFLLDQEFSSYEEAFQWWQQNQHRYDDNLFEK